ncbi:MAG: cyclic-di-AMP receptor [Huintestinicola sp.]
MKLIYAVINNDDSHAVSVELTKNGFQTTKLASTGGFLMAGNTTFLICADDNRVDGAIDIIRSFSRKRNQYVPSAGVGSSEASGTFPIEVSVGGATVFVTDIERFEKF